METTPATQVLGALQQFLRERGGRLCFLQSREVPGASSVNDVDMAVDRRAKQLLPAAFSHLRAEHGQHLVQAIQWDVPFSYYFVMAAGTAQQPSWIRPDISWDPEQTSANFISTEELLDHCVDRNGFQHLRPDVEWAYQVFKRLRKGGATPAQLAHAQALQHSVDSLSHGHRLLERRLPRALVHQLRGAIEDADGAKLRRLAKLAKPLLLLPRSATGPSAQVRHQLVRSQRRWNEPVGLVVWLQGHDPAGARSRAEKLTKTMAPVFRGRHHIAPLNARLASATPSLYRRVKLTRGELQVRTVHPDQKMPYLPQEWGVRVEPNECPIEVVLLHLEERMTQRGWYAPASQPG